MTFGRAILIYTTTQKKTHINGVMDLTITNIPAWFIGYLGIELHWSFLEHNQAARNGCCFESIWAEKLLERYIS